MTLFCLGQPSLLSQGLVKQMILAKLLCGNIFKEVLKITLKVDILGTIQKYKKPIFGKFSVKD
jgi:hypothetical protein